MIQEYAKKYPDRPILTVAYSTLNRIKQQYDMITKRTTNVSDDTIHGFQSTLNEVFINYDHELIMNCDNTRIQQSMTPTYTLKFKHYLLMLILV